MAEREELMRKYAPNLLADPVANPERVRTHGPEEDDAAYNKPSPEAMRAASITATGGATVTYATGSPLYTSAAHLFTTNVDDTNTAAAGGTVVADIGGRTLIAGPASVEPGIEGAGCSHQGGNQPSIADIAAAPMLHMHGRFVGSEVPNRNGALWSAEDLELAHVTAVNGPLNWLHEERHIIGSLTGAGFVGREAAAIVGVSQPHIAASAAIWKWIWPDEAYVVERFSELGQLWYSMECISKEVVCAGENGCGNTTTYDQYIAGATCEHVKERAAVRRFKDPVFLGGAVIVPPTQPGWADANASVMNKADGFAEAAFAQAGQPDIEATTWVSMMAQLVRYAEEAPGRTTPR